MVVQEATSASRGTQAADAMILKLLAMYVARQDDEAAKDFDRIFQSLREKFEQSESEDQFSASLVERLREYQELISIFS